MTREQFDAAIAADLDEIHDLIRRAKREWKRTHRYSTLDNEYLVAIDLIVKRTGDRWELLNDRALKDDHVLPVDVRTRVAELPS